MPGWQERLVVISVEGDPGHSSGKAVKSMFISIYLNYPIFQNIIVMSVDDSYIT